MADIADELVERLLKSAASLSQQQAARLADEARHQVEAEIRQLLCSTWKAALLRELVLHLEQPQRELTPPAAAECERRDIPRTVFSAAEACSPAEPAVAATRPAPTSTRDTTDTTARSRSTLPEQSLGYYAYGIVSSDHPSVPDDLPGVDPAFPVRMLRHGGLQVITSCVSSDEFCPEIWAERVADLEWVESKVRAHDRVLKAALQHGPLLPLRFGTVFDCEDALLRLLSEDHDRLLGALHRLDGKAEWGVKIIRLEAAAHRSPSARQEVGTSASHRNGSGRAYLIEKQRQRQARSTTQVEDESVARQCHESLSAAASEAVVLPVNRPAASRDAQKLILNGSYLLDRLQVQPFRELVEKLSERYQAQGLTFELTGPWPPYDFVDLELSLHSPDESISPGR